MREPGIYAIRRVRLAKGAAARGKAQSPEHRAKRIAALVAYHERRRNGLAV